MDENTNELLIKDIQNEIKHLNNCINWEIKHYNKWKEQWVKRFNEKNFYLALKALNSLIETRENIKGYKESKASQEELLRSYTRKRR